MNINMPDYLEEAVKEFDAFQLELDHAESMSALRMAEIRERTAMLLGILSIAQDLRRIAERMYDFSDNSEANDALRVNVLR